MRRNVNGKFLNGNKQTVWRLGGGRGMQRRWDGRGKGAASDMDGAPILSWEPELHGIICPYPLLKPETVAPLALTLDLDLPSFSTFLVRVGFIQRAPLRHVHGDTCHLHIPPLTGKKYQRHMDT